MEKKCTICGEVFEKKPYCSSKRWANRKFCGIKCKNIAQRGRVTHRPFGNTNRRGKKMSDESRKKMSEARTGRKFGPHTEEHKKKIGDAQRGEKGYWYGKKLKASTKRKLSIANKNGRGEENTNWRGDDITVGGIHLWLNREYGGPKRCDNKDCKYPQSKTKCWDWALIHEYEYKRDRSHFLRLCRSCHVKYDRNIIDIIK